MTAPKKHLVLLSFLFLFSGCATELPECDGPKIDLAQVKSLRKTLFTSGPRAALVVPNPIDATGNPTVSASDSSLSREIEGFFLPDTLSKKLENSFLKVRIKDLNDDLSTLAFPNAQGDYVFPLSDVHYSETMAYYSVSSMIHYVESLGFSIVRSRPLYIMVRSESDDGSDIVNALYSHNYLDPSLPRTMRLYGSGQFSPGIDRDMYWHEFGHFFNESVSQETGIDYAADSGAYFTEASALHECLADYLAESVGNKGDIGKWIARNFSDIPAGKALRSAVPIEDDLNTFENVSTYDGTEKNLDRYRMAEWCTRVLWDLRSQFVSEDPGGGAIFSDRLIYSAVSLLKRDTSMAQFRAALDTADQQLHCGFHAKSIDKAFESRGFPATPQKMESKLSIQGSAVGVNTSNGQSTLGNPMAGGEVAFQFRISNATGTTARNVRVLLESDDPLLIPVTYLQGYGDLPSGQSIVVGQGGLSLGYSVFGSIDSGARVKKIPFRLRVRLENGPDSVFQGEIQL